MKIIRHPLVLAILIGLFLYFMVYKFARIANNKINPEEVYVSTCGSCHMAPNPAHLPLRTWKENVLPDMGARLGIQVGNYDPFANRAPLESEILKEAFIYPPMPVISDEKWEQIVTYIEKTAPDELTGIVRNSENDTLHQFLPKVLNIDQNRRSLLTSIRYDDAMESIVVSNAQGEFWKWDGDSSTLMQQFYTSTVDFDYFKDNAYYLEIGQIHPTDQKFGKLWRSKNNGRPELLATDLKRPVFFEVEDLDEDGIEELILCEFGHQIGQLSMLRYDGDALKRTTLLPFPGASKVIIRDMNGDNRKDIVALMAQGNEAVYILYQQEDLRFSTKLVFQLSSLYGSSDIDLIDFDHDGDLDIVVACGDNADLSIMLKKYHGIYLYLNDGHNQFSESFFYPVYGATCVVAKDFDKDSDIDFAISAYFPDFDENLIESFVYLENQNTGQYTFKSFVTPYSLEGRWITLESGDIDDDGDLDMFLGSFTYAPDNPNRFVQDKWDSKKADMIFFENLLISKNIP